MNIIFTENKYPIAKTICWDDIIEKLSKEYSSSTIIWNHLLIHPPKEEDDTNKNFFSHDGSHPPTFLMIEDYYPGNFEQVFNFVSEDCGVKVLHTYASFGENSMTFKNHFDDVDVLLVQARGSTKYRCDEQFYTLNPGDSLFLPKGVYHEPIVIGPRITLSFSWE